MLMRDEDRVDLLVRQVALQVRQQSHAEVEDEVVPTGADEEAIGCAAGGGPGT